MENYVFVKKIFISRINMGFYHCEPELKKQSIDSLAKKKFQE